MGTTRHFGEHHDEVMATYHLLRDTWSAVDPRSNITLYPASYSETFLDMARVLVAAQHPRESAGLLPSYPRIRAVVDAYREAGS